MERTWSTKKWARHGEKHSQWKGGRSVDRHGYAKLNINLIEPEFHCMCDSSGWVLEHRYLMAKKIGRPLNRGELIHHLDENKTNNNLDNLELTTRSEHMKSHRAHLTMQEAKRKRNECAELIGKELSLIAPNVFKEYGKEKDS